MFQDFRLLNHLSAFDNVALPLRVKARAKIWSASMSESYFDGSDWPIKWMRCRRHFRVDKNSASPLHAPSLAVPNLLLADEPTGNVDDTIAVRLLYLFEEMNRLGTTVVIATHNKSLVQRFGHPVMRLRDGHVEEEEDASDWGAGPPPATGLSDGGQPGAMGKAGRR